VVGIIITALNQTELFYYENKFKKPPDWWMDKTEEEKHEILTYCQKAADLDQSKFFLLDYCNLDNFCAQEFMSMYCFFLFGKLAPKINGRF